MPDLPLDTVEAERLTREHLTGKTPGAAVAMTSGGAAVFTACHGFADLEWETPVTPATVFTLASVTKPFTALAILCLERDGVLDLDAPLAEHVPEFAAVAPGVRLHHLLTHTSGVPDFTDDDGFQKRCRLDQSDEELIAEFASKPLEFAVGSQYGYSNTGYRLLEIIAARATGRPFAEVLAEKVFSPAGMSDTRLLTNADIVARRARGYTADNGVFANASHVNMAVLGGAGGIGATLEDLLRFDRALRTESIATIALQRRMFRPATLPHHSVEGYGLGWEINTLRGRRTVFHTGGIYGFSTLYARLPEEDIGVVVLANAESFSCANLARDLIALALDLRPPRHPTMCLPEPDLAARAGRYRDMSHHFDVTPTADGLVVSQFDRTFTMLPISPTSYYAPEDPDMRLSFHDDNPAAAGTLHYPFWWCTGYRSAAE
ncbi:serine hydrolase domain-containing protein [Kutzneria sp. NPDC052558]|uniref:serine hydrolase domain-containing protein n=1 Tax=Kutzneria sp. NPDC052558 TaxID=3364121 RepID=UPI0037C76EE8